MQTTRPFTSTTRSGLLTTDALKIKLSDPRYSEEVKLATLDHAYRAARADGDDAQAEAIAELWRGFYPSTEFSSPN